MKLFMRLLLKWPTERALRLAAALGLVALVLMCLGILVPNPLSIVISMSVSQAFGVSAAALLFVSIAADLAQAKQKLQSLGGGGSSAP